jgi:hypothetical protein
LRIEILEDLLLYRIKDIETVQKIITDSVLIVIPAYFILELIFNNFRDNPDLMESVKRLLIVQFVIFAVPTFYDDVAKFGFNLGNEIISRKQKASYDQNGILNKWQEVKNKFERDHKQKATLGDTFFNFIKFESTDLIEKGATLFLLIITLLLKVIYTAIYYGTYFTISLRALMAIDRSYSSNLEGIKTSIIYLLLVPIIVAIILYFINDISDFSVSDGGFLESLSSIASLIVLGILLFASLKIAQSIVSGKGVESWGANTGGLLSTAIPLLAGKAAIMGASSNGLKSTASFTANSTGSLLKSLAPVGSTLASAALSPAKMAYSGTKQGLSNHFKNKIEQQSRNQSNHDGVSFSIGNNTNQNYSNLSNQTTQTSSYESVFRSITGNESNIRLRDAINPINHVKASSIATKDSFSSGVNNIKNNIGLPQNSSQLTLGQKFNHVGNKVFNGSNSLNEEEQIKNTILANQISKRLEDEKE